MSGTALTSEKTKTYTVLGRGPSTPVSHDLSVIHLVRGRRYQRVEDIEALASRGYSDTLIVMPRDPSIQLEPLIAGHDNLRILLIDRDVFDGAASPGELINLAIGEARGKFCLVYWGDVQFTLSESALKQLNPTVLCHLPLVVKSNGTPHPSFSIPVKSFARGGDFIDPVPVISDGREQQSLYPFDYIAIYSRERFVRSAGFDAEITNAHWQKLEYGYRSQLWGEKMFLLPGFKVKYLGEIEADETTPDRSYLKFYVKVLAVEYSGDRAVLPIPVFFRILRASSGGLFAALRDFLQARRWVFQHRYHFKRDVRQLAELWGDDHE